MIAVQEMTK